jgi:hypothetical protein
MSGKSKRTPNPSLKSRENTEQMIHALIQAATEQPGPTTRETMNPSMPVAVEDTPRRTENRATQPGGEIPTQAKSVGTPGSSSERSSQEAWEAWKAKEPKRTGAQRNDKEHAHRSKERPKPRQGGNTRSHDSQGRSNRGNSQRSESMDPRRSHSGHKRAHGEWEDRTSSRSESPQQHDHRERGRTAQGRDKKRLPPEGSRKYTLVRVERERNRDSSPKRSKRHGGVC